MTLALLLLLVVSVAADHLVFTDKSCTGPIHYNLRETFCSTFKCEARANGVYSQGVCPGKTADMNMTAGQKYVMYRLGKSACSDYSNVIKTTLFLADNQCRFAPPENFYVKASCTMGWRICPTSSCDTGCSSVVDSFDGTCTNGPSASVFYKCVDSSYDRNTSDGDRSSVPWMTILAATGISLMYLLF